MRLRNVRGSRETIAESNYVVHEDIMFEQPGKWHEIFGNDNPIHIEIGMGKGQFIHALAKLHPEINYVGIEKYSSVLLRAIQKMDAEELPNLKFLRMEAEDINYIGIERYTSVLLRAVQKIEENPLPNVRFLCEDAANLPDIFAAEEVKRIYLNFSDPWPKDRHAKRRLPSREFLARYNEILKPESRLEFKTDNRPLFDFAVEELEPAGWKAQVITYDLHADEKLVEGNIMTEYEEKFSSMGNPICKYIIYR